MIVPTFLIVIPIEGNGWIDNSFKFRFIIVLKYILDFCLSGILEGDLILYESNVLVGYL